METFIQIIITILGSAGLFTFIEFLIRRHDSKNDRIAALEKQMKECELNDCRIQLLLLMQLEDNENEVLRVAEHYFSDLNGNWYMASLFSKWCEKHSISVPDFVV